MILSMSILSLSRIVMFTEEENKAYSKLKKLGSIENKEHKACNVIKVICFIKEFYGRTGGFARAVDKRNKLTVIAQEQKAQNLFIEEKYILLFLLHFYLKRFVDPNTISSSYSLPMNHCLKRIKNKIKENFNSMMEIFEITENIDVTLNDFLQEQYEISEKVSNIVTKQKNILSFLMNRFNEMHLQKMKYKKSCSFVEIKKQMQKNKTKFHFLCSPKKKVKLQTMLTFS